LFTPVPAQHSKSFSCIDCVSVGVERSQRNFDEWLAPNGNRGCPGQVVPPSNKRRRLIASGRCLPDWCLRHARIALRASILAYRCDITESVLAVVLGLRRYAVRTQTLGEWAIGWTAAPLFQPFAGSQCADSYASCPPIFHCPFMDSLLMDSLRMADHPRPDAALARSALAIAKCGRRQLRPQRCVRRKRFTSRADSFTLQNLAGYSRFRRESDPIYGVTAPGRPITAHPATADGVEPWGSSNRDCS
jgi:hypothetical protein